MYEIKDLARELSLSGDEVLEKAKAMGIKVSGTSDDLSDIDTTADKKHHLKGWYTYGNEGSAYQGEEIGCRKKRRWS